MITTITFNPSIDRMYRVSSMNIGEVQRVVSAKATAGGKGINVTKVCKILQEDTLAMGFLGGYNGEFIKEELRKLDIKSKFTKINQETRNCLNIITDDKVSTEFLEKGSSVNKNEIDKFIEDFNQIIDNSNIITISGSVPQGVPTDIYATLIKMIKAKNKKVILDASGDLLKEGIKALPTMIKPNSEEMENLLGISINNREEVIKSAIKLYESGIELVVVSLGGDGALLVCEEGVYHGKPPKIKVVNTVGCGDSMVAAFAVAMERGYSNIDSLKYAVSISAANAMTFSTGNFNSKDADSIFENTIIEKIY